MVSLYTHGLSVLDRAVVGLRVSVVLTLQYDGQGVAGVVLSVIVQDLGAAGLHNQSRRLQ